MARKIGTVLPIVLVAYAESESALLLQAKNMSYETGLD